MQKITIFFLIKVICYKSRKYNCENWTPLHYAASNNSKEVGEMLLKKGADFTLQDI